MRRGDVSQFCPASPVSGKTVNVIDLSSAYQPMTFRWCQSNFSDIHPRISSPEYFRLGGSEEDHISVASRGLGNNTSIVNAIPEHSAVQLSRCGRLRIDAVPRAIMATGFHASSFCDDRGWSWTTLLPTRVIAEWYGAELIYSSWPMIRYLLQTPRIGSKDTPNEPDHSGYSGSSPPRVICFLATTPSEEQLLSNCLTLEPYPLRDIVCPAPR